MFGWYVVSVSREMCMLLLAAQGLIKYNNFWTAQCLNTPQPSDFQTSTTSLKLAEYMIQSLYCNFYSSVIELLEEFYCRCLCVFWSNNRVNINLKCQQKSLSWPNIALSIVIFQLSYDVLTLLAENCINLEELHLSGVRCVNDALLISFAENFPFLKYLSLKSCTHGEDHVS